MGAIKHVVKQAKLNPKRIVLLEATDISKAFILSDLDSLSYDVLKMNELFKHYSEQ